MVRELREGSGPPHDPGDSSRTASDGSVEQPHGISKVAPFSSRRNELITRVAFLAAAAYAFAAGMRVYGGAGIWEPAIPLGLLLYVGALVSLLLAFMTREPSGRSAQIFLVSIIMVALVGSVAYEISVGVESYGTDSIAISHVAGEMLLDGENPYAVVGQSLSPIIERFGIPDTFVTQTLSGESIDRLVVYPAGHVVTYAGALALGVDDMRWVTLAFEVAALAVIWWALSPQARFLVPLALLVEPNLTIYFTSGGVTDWLWVLPLVVTALMLHRRQWGYAGIALGIACAMKQQPWFVVPFVLVWAFMEIRARGEREAVKRDFGALVFGTLAGFAILNIPFLIWGPADWLSGTLSPLLDNLVPDGQGPSILASRGFLPVPQMAFSIAMAVVFAIALYLYYRRFDQMRNLLWVLPAVVLFFSHRSLHNYFIFWIPVAALWLDLEMLPTRNTPNIESPRTKPVSPWIAASAIGAVVFASGAVGWFLASGDTIQVDSVLPMTEEGVITALDVEITNTGDQPLEPVFGIYWGRYAVPWETAEPTSIEPGKSSVVRIVPAGGGVLPPLAATGDDALRVSPFRVRVSDAGHGEYASSTLIEPEPFTVAVVNPHFGFWGTPIGILHESPYGWTGTRLTPSGSSVEMEVLDGGGGLMLGVRRERDLPGGWAEVAAVQDVAAVAGCYNVDLSYVGSYISNAEGRPRAVSGLQVLQGDAAVWFVLSDIDRMRTTDLAEGTRVVEMPATPGSRQQESFDLTQIAGGTQIEVGEPATLKLFSGLDENQVGPIELRVHSIETCG
jgi:hypothetical protein